MNEKDGSFSLCYSQGVHRVMVDVSYDDFWKVIDDMRSEFVIVKDFGEKDITYYFVNYYDTRTLIGIHHLV